MPLAESAVAKVEPPEQESPQKDQLKKDIPMEDVTVAIDEAVDEEGPDEVDGESITKRSDDPVLQDSFMAEIDIGLFKRL